MKLEELEDSRLVRKSIKPLSKLYHIEPSWTENYLENPPAQDKNILVEQLENWKNPHDSKIRQITNNWWVNHNKFLASIGEKKLAKSKPSRLPEATYRQIIVLSWLTFALECERVRRNRRVKTVAKPKPPTFWRRIITFIKKLLRL